MSVNHGGQSRRLINIIEAQASQDGDGVKIARIAGPQLFAQLDPFLLLDEIASDDSADYVGGFPPHPHRGFETITYMLQGRMRHRDHMGNQGLLEPGDVQWMTAGRGVIHSEMPEQNEGRLHGFQLWLNLPAQEKMKPAAYQDLKADQIPVHVYNNDVELKLIAGRLMLDAKEQNGPLAGPGTEPLIADIKLPPYATVELPIGDERNLMTYVYQGALHNLPTSTLGIYGSGNSLILTGTADQTRVLVLAGKPLREPVVQQGPFVMNTAKQIQQAMEDYRLGRLTT